MTFPSAPALNNAFENSGRLWLRNALSPPDLEYLDRTANLHAKAGQRIKSPQTLSNCLSLSQSIAKLAPDALPVRLVAFNKSEGANWGVPWHQDRVIAVAQKQDIQGYKNWTLKSGGWHCEPPLNVLKKLLFVRVHLDDTDDTNGAMKIALGSHKCGIVPTKEAKVTAAQFPVESCAAKRGDILILKMLTLHCSSPSRAPTSRRALRVDYALEPLPAPLHWA